MAVDWSPISNWWPMIKLHECHKGGRLEDNIHSKKKHWPIFLDHHRSNSSFLISSFVVWKLLNISNVLSVNNVIC